MFFFFGGGGGGGALRDEKPRNWFNSIVLLFVV